MVETPDGGVCEFLGSLDREELVRRVLDLAERDEIALTALRAEAAVAAGTFELAAFRKELTARLRVSGYVERRRARDYAGRVDGVADVLEQLLAGGRAAEVVVAAEPAIQRLDTAMNRIDDSNGHVGSAGERLRKVHHAACAAARPEPRKLAVRLVELELKTTWEWFLDAPERYAEILGDEGLAAYRERLEREWEPLPQLPPDRERRFFHSFDGRRSTITFLRESLARAGGSVDELVSVLARDLSSAFQFCRIADELERAGREREALSWVERGIAAFPPAGDVRLRERALRAYLRDGQVEDAAALVQRAFDSEPSPGTYAELRGVTGELAGAGELREAALERLRRSERFGGRSGAVRAQLEEGDVEGAWLDASEEGCTWDLWRRLADARRTEHPDESLGVYRRLLERALERADERSYEDVVELLKAMGETLLPRGRAGELQAEVARIRKDYVRRRRLLAMLGEAGF